MNNNKIIYIFYIYMLCSIMKFDMLCNLHGGILIYYVKFVISYFHSLFIAILGRFTVMKQKLGRSTVIGQKLGNLTVMRQKLGCFTVMKHILSWFLPTNFKQNVLIHDTYLKSNVMISDNYLKLIKRHTKFCEIGNPNFIKPKWSHIVSLYIE